MKSAVSIVFHLKQIQNMDFETLFLKPRHYRTIERTDYQVKSLAYYFLFVCSWGQAEDDVQAVRQGRQRGDRPRRDGGYIHKAMQGRQLGGGGGVDILARLRLSSLGVYSGGRGLFVMVLC